LLGPPLDAAAGGGTCFPDVAAALATAGVKRSPDGLIACLPAARGTERCQPWAWPTILTNFPELRRMPR